MKVIIAPNKIEKTDLPTVFLAGGITDCPEWQDDIIRLLGRYGDAILLNPRRKNFPIHDPEAAEEQITWEFHALNNCDIFSMWFSASESVQPICMYELGRHLALKSPDRMDRIVIGIEPGYKRERDVRIQTGLVSKNIIISGNLQDHASRILNAVEGI